MRQAIGRLRSFAFCGVALIIAPSITTAQENTTGQNPKSEKGSDPKTNAADERFESLLAEARKTPEKADWPALRRAFAETSHYHPYSTDVREKLRTISKDVAAGEFVKSEKSLIELVEHDRFMRLDSLAMLMMLYEKTDQAEKFNEYKPMLLGILGVLKYPESGTSFENPIHVLYIDEEYLVIAGMPLKSQGLAIHDQHRFDVLDIKASEDEPEKKIYFNIDLPHGALAKQLRLETKGK